MFLEGFNDCLLGIAHMTGDDGTVRARAVYGADLMMISLLREGMDGSEVQSHIENTIMPQLTCERSPLIVWRVEFRSLN